MHLLILRFQDVTEDKAVLSEETVVHLVDRYTPIHYTSLTADVPKRQTARSISSVGKKHRLSEGKKCAKNILPLSPSLFLYVVLKSDRTNIWLVPVHRDFATPPDTQAQKEDKPRSNSTSQSIFLCRAKLRDRLPPICSLRKCCCRTQPKKKGEGK